MTRAECPGLPGRASVGAVPRDVRKALDIMRADLCSRLAMAELANSCGVAERTLNEHFRAFLRVPPMRYLRRLRLAAAREALLAGNADTSVTAVARRFLFDHAGRFSEEYKQRFGELPSATLRRACGAADGGSDRTPVRATDPGDSRGDAWPRPAMASREKPSIAIVPGAAPANEPALRALAVAVAEAVAADLWSVRAVTVKLAAAALAGSQDVVRLRRESGCRYILAGRFVRDGPRLRYTVRLTDAIDGAVVWGDSFDGAVDRVLALQDRVVEGIRRGIVGGIRGAEIDRASRRAICDIDASGLALRALPLLQSSTAEGAHRALDLLGRAADIDPDYGLAAALAAWGHAQLVMYNGTAHPAEERGNALRLAHRAAILDDEDPLAITARCAVHTMVGDFALSDRLVARALAHDPCLGLAWGRSGWLRACRGDSAGAIRHFCRALRLGPAGTRANIMAGIGSAHFNAHRYAPAASWLQRALKTQPGITWPNRSLSASFEILGEHRRGRETLAALRRAHPDLTVRRVTEAVPFQPDFLERLGNGLTALGLPP